MLWIAKLDDGASIGVVAGHNPAKFERHHGSPRPMLASAGGSSPGTFGICNIGDAFGR